MGIGRNLAYRKSLYEKHKGFTDHLQLQRGEDDLFINAVANKYNTRVASVSRTCDVPNRMHYQNELG